MPLSDWRDGYEHADAVAGAPAIYDRAYLQGNIAGGEGIDWFYASAADRRGQVRTPITNGAAGKAWVFRYKDLRGWWENLHVKRPAGVEAGTPTAWVPRSKPIVFTEAGCPAGGRQQVALGVRQDMTLAALDLLTRGVAARPPLSVVFTDWLSMMPAVGSGSRPAIRRAATARLSLRMSRTPLSRSREK
jgi:hypothetical protein